MLNKLLKYQQLRSSSRAAWAGNGFVPLPLLVRNDFDLGVYPFISTNVILLIIVILGYVYDMYMTLVEIKGYT